MEAILLGIYAVSVWLIFIQLKWLPWNTKSQVVVVIIPIVGLTALILLLNVYAPSSSQRSRRSLCAWPPTIPRGATRASRVP